MPTLSEKPIEVEIEGSELLITLFDLYLKEINQEAVEREDDEDIPAELSMLIVIELDNKGLGL